VWYLAQTHSKMAASTMRAVVFKGPFKVEVEEQPIPKIQDPEDIVVKVTYTALCGRCV
jgi:Threonine dehydrogenase and related Zn-dependent dehydrogenases